MSAWHKSIRCVVVLLFLSGVHGCRNLSSPGTVREESPPRQASLATSYQFDDIPIPPQSTLMRKDSFIFETGRIKTGLLTYETKGEMGQLTAFFKQKMGQFQWRLVSNFELNSVMLIFMKEGVTAVIYILPQEGEGKRIEIRVGPVDMKLVPAS
jgi:hypothetical protein